MTKKQKAKQTKRQIKEMVKDFEKGLMQKVDSALISGALNENSIFYDDNALLAKAVMDSAMRERPYHSNYYKTEFDNLHTFI
jgi:hypothetical protein